MTLLLGWPHLAEQYSFGIILEGHMLHQLQIPALLTVVSSHLFRIRDFEGVCKKFIEEHLAKRVKIAMTAPTKLAMVVIHSVIDGIVDA